MYACEGRMPRAGAVKSEKVYMKRFFYLGSEKLIRLFVQKVLKGAGHDIYCTDSLDDLFVIHDLDSQIILIDFLFLSKLPDSFFEAKRQYVVLGTEGELSALDGHRPFKTLSKPLSMDDLLSL